MELTGKKAFVTGSSHRIAIELAGDNITVNNVAPVVALLASDEGRCITGQSIFVDGGKSVQ